MLRTNHKFHHPKTIYVLNYGSFNLLTILRQIETQTSQSYRMTMIHIFRSSIFIKFVVLLLQKSLTITEALYNYTHPLAEVDGKVCKKNHLLFLIIDPELLLNHHWWPGGPLKGIHHYNFLHSYVIFKIKIKIRSKFNKDSS